MKVEVHLLGGTRKVIDIDPSATRGATVGVNVWNQDGTLFVPAAGGGGSGVSVAAWELILNIPPNVTALANTSTTGLYAITGAGTSATRTIQGTAGRTSVTNGSGVAGDPAVDLATLTDSGIGAALVRITRDAWGRVEGQASAILDDLADVDLTTTPPTSGDALVFDGAAWVPGASGGGLGGVVTATIPSASMQHTQTLAAAGVTPTSIVTLSFAATTDLDENTPELLTACNMMAIPGTNQITVNLSFRRPESGPIKLNWSAI